MTYHSEKKQVCAGRRRRGTALRTAGVGLVLVIVFAIPVGGISSIRADGPSAAPSGQSGLTALPAGWPGPAPELKTPLEAEVWALVRRQCLRFGLAEKALAMYHVIWEESRLVAKARSACGRYHGICQFTLPTFRSNADEMRRMGIAAKDGVYSPFDPEHAIEVMAWMWSQGYESQWGPYRRVMRRLAKTRLASRLLNEPGK